MPATIVRCSVPTSIVQLHQLLRLRHALGGEHLATRRSTFMKSSIEMRLSAAAAASGGGGAGAAGARGGRRRRRRRGRDSVDRSHVSPWSKCWRSRRRPRSFEPRPERVALLHGALAARPPRGVAIETQVAAGVGAADPPQDLRARRRHDRRSRTAATRSASAASNSTASSARVRRRPCASAHGSVGDVLVGRVDEPERVAAPRVERVAVHRARGSCRRAVDAASASARRRRGAVSAPAAIPLAPSPSRGSRGCRGCSRGRRCSVSSNRSHEKSPSLPNTISLRQIQPQRIGAEPVRRLERIDDRAERLAHLLALGQHPAVAEDLPRQRQARAHQHRRPDDAVEPRDVLADHVQVGRPPRARTARRRCRSPTAAA